MKKIVKIKFPGIGMRIIKSSVAIALCYVVSLIRGNSGIVFYSQLSALWCMQMYRTNTKKNAYQRFLGTIIGALYGLIFLLIRPALVKMTTQMNHATLMSDILGALVISLMIILVLYSTVLIRKKQASYFSCVVFLSIAVNHIMDENPYLFVWNRFLDTVIGIVIGVCVNDFHLPVNPQRDILFISGLDNTLLTENDSLSDYSKVELNRMLDDGMAFTISTLRTPASLMEPLRDVRLNLPVIAMDGAVLFDICEHRYIRVYIISNEKSQQILKLIHDSGLHCFSNVIIDDMLVIYYEDTEDEVQNRLVADMRKSPFRNYVKRELPKTEEVVYFMILEKKERLEKFYEKLISSGYTKELKILYYDSQDYPGYSYIKIYNKNASKEHMIKYLKDMLKIEKVMKLGTIPETCDCLIEENNANQVVKELTRLFEPIGFNRNKK